MLDQRVQHLAQDVLLGHGLRRDVHHVVAAAAIREREGPARDQHHGRARGHDGTRAPTKVLARFLLRSGALATVRARRLEVAARRLLGQPQQQVNDDGQQRDQHAARQRHGLVACRDAAVDGHAQAARADEAGDAGQRDGHGGHVADAAHDDGRGQRQLDAVEQLAVGGAHAARRLDDGGVDGGEAGVGVAHHRQQRVHGERHDGREVADARDGDEEAEQRDGRDGVHEVHQREHRFRAAPPLGDGNAQRQPDEDRQRNGYERDAYMLKEQVEKPSALLDEQLEQG